MSRKVKLGIVRTIDPLQNCEDIYDEFYAQIENNGLDIEIIEAPRRIGDGANASEDASLVCNFFEEKEVDVTVLMCCRLVGDGRVVHPFLDSNQELAVWCAPEPAAEGYLLLNAMTCANLYMSAAKMHRPDKKPLLLYGHYSDPKMSGVLLPYLMGLAARKALQNAVVVQIGKTAEGFTNLSYDADLVRDKYGVSIVDYSLEDCFRDMEQTKAAEVNQLADDIESGNIFGCCAQACTALKSEIQQTAKLVLALRKVEEELQADAFSVRCWPEFEAGLGFSTCVAFAVLSLEGTVVACEGDAMGAVTMLAQKAMSGKIPMLMDLVNMDTATDSLSFWHCGFGIPEYAKDCNYSITGYPSDSRILELPGPGIDMEFAEGAVTVSRISGNGGENIFACDARVVPGPGEGNKGARGWLSDFVFPENDGKKSSAYEFFEKACFSGCPHHYIISYGHSAKGMMEFARLTGSDVSSPD